MALAKEAEEWRELKFYPGYEVSNLGDIRDKLSRRSLSRTYLDKHTPIVTVRKDGRPYSRALQALVKDEFPELSHE